MTFGQPLWLLLLLGWGLVPILDRLARPTIEAALPIAHLGNRGLRRLPAVLPWLSVHALALVLLILALAQPQWPGPNRHRAEPAVAVVVAADPMIATAGKRFDEWLDRCDGRDFLLLTADHRSPKLVVPLTDRAAYGLGLWPAAVDPAMTGEDVAKAVLMAGAKAPLGSWVVVIGGPVGGRGWATAQAALAARHQRLALLTADAAGLGTPPAFAAAPDDPDAAGALAYQLASVTRQTELPGDHWPLAMPCLVAALVVLLANWVWRHGRWAVVGP